MDTPHYLPTTPPTSSFTHLPHARTVNTTEHIHHTRHGLPPRAAAHHGPPPPRAGHPPHLAPTRTADYPWLARPSVHSTPPHRRCYRLQHFPTTPPQQAPGETRGALPLLPPNHQPALPTYRHTHYHHLPFCLQHTLPRTPQYTRGSFHFPITTPFPPPARRLLSRLPLILPFCTSPCTLFCTRLPLPAPLPLHLFWTRRTIYAHLLAHLHHHTILYILLFATWVLSCQDVKRYHLCTTHNEGNLMKRKEKKENDILLMIYMKMMMIKCGRSQ